MDFDTVLRDLKQQLRVDVSFDMLTKEITVGNRRGALFFVDGLTKDEALDKVLQFLAGLSDKEIRSVTEAQTFAAAFIPFGEVSCTADTEKIIRQVLSGMSAMLIEGLDKVILMDTRSYPAREVAEPETDRVMRGSRDGLVETLVHNTALIRRRLRSPSLTFEILTVGELSATDVCLCYMDDRVDRTFLRRLRQKIRSISIPSLAMGQESLAECLLEGQWYNPFPRVRYSERPDCAAAGIAEGQVVILVDNSPAAMLLPTSIFCFSQDTNDYYFPPIVGTYLRLVRGLIFMSTLFITPVWFWLVEHPEHIPPWLSFMQMKSQADLPLVIQLFLVEVLIDALKLASLNTPNSLSNALSLVGALVFGEFAVEAGFFVPELLAYMAFVSVATFTQPSRELTYAFKLFRMMFLLLIWLCGGWGLLIGMATMAVVLITTKTVVGTHYLYPLFPFDGKALWRLMIRQPISPYNAASQKTE